VAHLITSCDSPMFSTADGSVRRLVMHQARADALERPVTPKFVENDGGGQSHTIFTEATPSTVSRWIEKSGGWPGGTLNARPRRTVRDGGSAGESQAAGRDAGSTARWLHRVHSRYLGLVGTKERVDVAAIKAAKAEFVHPFKEAAALCGELTDIRWRRATICMPTARDGPLAVGHHETGAPGPRDPIEHEGEWRGESLRAFSGFAQL
jgi:hypothetical protein